MVTMREMRDSIRTNLIFDARKCKYSGDHQQEKPGEIVMADRT